MCFDQSRAAAATALLQELNDAVAGSFVDEAPDALLAANPRFLADFALVIATQARSIPAAIRRPKAEFLLVIAAHSCSAACSCSWPLSCVEGWQTMLSGIRLLVGFQAFRLESAYHA